MDFYIKKGDTFEKVGFGGDILFPGIWLVQIEPGSKTMYSLGNLLLKVGDVPHNPCADLKPLASFKMIGQLICSYLLKVTSKNEYWDSKEVKFLKPPKIGQDIKGEPTNVEIYNISLYELSEKIAEHLYEEYLKKAELPAEFKV